MSRSHQTNKSPCQRVVITGGSSGLGLALAGRFSGAGASVALIARSAAKLDAAAEELRSLSAGGRVSTAAVDVTDETATEKAMTQLAEEMGGIDLLINSAGILREGYFETLPSSAFREVLEINVMGVVHATRAALPQLKESRGQIVNIASVAGLGGVFGYTPYCASKHALVGLTESLYYELRPQGVVVKLVCPAEFDSPMVDALEQGRTPENRLHTLMIPKSPIEEIAESAWRAIHSNRFLTVTGRRAALAALGLRHFPRLTRAVAARAIGRAYAGPNQKESS